MPDNKYYLDKGSVRVMWEHEADNVQIKINNPATNVRAMTIDLSWDDALILARAILEASKHLEGKRGS